MTEEARNTRPDEVDDVRRQYPELDGVFVEQVYLERCPGKPYNDEPQDHRRVVVLERVQDVVLHGPSFD